MSIGKLKMLLLLSFLSIAPICDSFKILVINPKFAYSHMNFLGQVADTLVDAGHDVVTLQPLMSTLFASNGTTKSRLIQVGPSAELNELLRIHHASAVKQDIWTSSLRNPFALLAFTTSINDIIYRTTLDLISNEKLLQQLKAEKFDVAITELFEFIGFGVLEAINIKNIIGVHTITSVMERASIEIGNPVIPSYVPASTGVTGDSSDFFARLLNLLFVYTSWKFQSSFASAAEQAMMEKLGPTATPIWDTVSNISWLLVNSEPLLDFDRPTLHKIVPIGGLGVRQPKSLSKEWSRILSIRKRNVLVSFGSVAPTSKMPKEMKQTVLNAIKSHPDITFIWKYDQLDDPNAAGVDNLILSKWTPQTDLLADDRLTLFITHCGAGSMMESATFGKPLVAIPLFADQMRNAQLAEKFGFGVIVEKSDLVAGSVLEDSLNSVLNDPKYRTAALRMKNLLGHRPFTPQQKLVKTVELAAQFGDMPELKVSGRKLGFVVYYNLDLLAMLFAIFALMTFVPLYLLYRCTRGRFSDSKVKTQ